MFTKHFATILGLAILAASACKKEPAFLCTPGESKACACADGRTGAQSCLVDGRGLAPCVCQDAAGAVTPTPPAAAAAPAPAPAGADNLVKAKALIDRMAADLDRMTTEVEGAGTDQAKIKGIGDKFKVQAEAMKSEGEALRKNLSEAENTELEGYAKEKITPLTGRLMAAMMKAQASAQDPGGAAPAPETGLLANLRSAKAAEANEMLDLIKKGAASYYTTPRVSKETGARIPAQFPRSVGLTPPGASCCDPQNDADNDKRCDARPGSWNNATWAALRFAITDQHYFQYRFESSGVGAAAKYTASAHADLDCDGVQSTFQLVGTGDADCVEGAACDQVGPAAIFRDNETE